jgi:hypothetical protein
MKTRSLLACTISIFCYFLVFRPHIIRWGATDDEANEPLPGDEFTPDARLISTHAITINASADQIWPWIVQIGNGRAGWYSFRFIEQLVGDGILLDEGASWRILPEFQNLKPGDRIPVANEAFKVIDVQSHRYLSLLTGFKMTPSEQDKTRSHSGFTFVLSPIDPQTTRLIARARFVSQSVLETLTLLGFLEPGHFIMQTKMLHGIKERVEAQTQRL